MHYWDKIIDALVQIEVNTEVLVGLEPLASAMHQHNGSVQIRQINTEFDE